MNLTFLFFIIGLSLFIIGYANQLNPTCKEKEQIKFVPRDVFDSLVLTNILH